MRSKWDAIEIEFWHFWSALMFVSLNRKLYIPCSINTIKKEEISVKQKYGRRHTTTYHYAQIVLRHIRRSQSPIYPKWIEWNTQIEDFWIHFFFLSCCRFRCRLASSLPAISTIQYLHTTTLSSRLMCGRIVRGASSFHRYMYIYIFSIAHIYLIDVTSCLLQNFSHILSLKETKKKNVKNTNAVCAIWKR